MQLFVADEILRELRQRRRDAGTLTCLRTPRWSLFAVRSGESPQALYPALRAARDADRTCRVPFVLADVPNGRGPWILQPATSLVDRSPLTPHLARLRGLPHLPADYQPYLEVMLERGHSAGLLVVGPSDSAFLRPRRRHGLPHEQWTRVPMTTTPIPLPHVGKGKLVDGKRFVLLGAGSLGSRVAELLAAAGAASIVVVDPDTLEPRNLRRHLCGVEHVGRPKAHAVRDVLNERGFDTEITPLIGRAQGELAGEVRAHIAASDLVLCTTDSAPPRHFANHAAVHSAVPSLIADVQLRPEPLAEIVAVIPGRGGCFNCWRTELASGGVMEPPTGHDPADYPEDGGPAPSGLPMYQLTLVAAAACDLAGVALAQSPESLKWLVALDQQVADFPCLEDPRRVRLEALDQHAKCEVCRP